MHHRQIGALTRAIESNAAQRRYAAMGAGWSGIGGGLIGTKPATPEKPRAVQNDNGLDQAIQPSPAPSTSNG